MAAEFESGMFAREGAWHGFGTIVPENVSWQEAIRVAGLDWDVSKRRAFIQSFLAAPGVKAPVECAGFKALVRTKDDSVFAVVTDKYQPIQNTRAFETFGGLFGDKAVLHTAGSLRGGKIVWGLAEFPEAFTVGHDAHKRYLLVTTRHDGTGALRAFPTAVRVVCANTLNMALGARRDGIAIRHTGNVDSKITQQTEVLAKAFAMFDEYKKNMEKLMECKMDSNMRRDVVGQLVNLTTTRGKNAARKIVELADTGAGNDAYQGTAYALFQGVTDYVDHFRSPKATAEKRFESTMLSSGAAIKMDALQLLMDAAKVRVAA